MSLISREYRNLVRFDRRISLICLAWRLQRLMALLVPKKSKLFHKIAFLATIQRCSFHHAVLDNELNRSQSFQILVDFDFVNDLVALVYLTRIGIDDNVSLLQC